MEIAVEDKLVVVYRLDGPPLLLDRDRIVFTDRTRGLTRDRCNRKAYIEYEAFDTGLQSTGWNEDIEIGSTVHRGLEALMRGEDLTQAIEWAQAYYTENRPPFDWLIPEIDDVLYQDGLHLATALLYAFDRRMLGHIQEKFEILEAETEINWLMGELEDGRYIVMMSRPDGVWREKATGKLWHVSFKTTKKFDQQMADKLEIDQQKWSEGFAIQAKYGEPVAGTLYYYLIKGNKAFDKVLQVDRWWSGLIRPWLNERAHTGGVIEPENLYFEHDYYCLDERKNKRLGVGWRKIDIYREMPFEDYLDYLDRELVGPNAPHGRDFLQESVTGPSTFDGMDQMAVLWNGDHARRWLLAKIVEEERWLTKIQKVGPVRFGDYSYVFDTELKVMDSEQCFSYRSRCPHYAFCWKGKSLEQLIEEGKLAPRTANHPVEMEE